MNSVSFTGDVPLSAPIDIRFAIFSTDLVEPFGQELGCCFKVVLNVPAINCTGKT